MKTTHTIKGDKSNHEILLGWDSVLRTFYLHVIDTSRDDDEEERDLLWIGCEIGENIGLAEIDINLKRYHKAGIDDYLLIELYREMRNSGPSTRK